MTTVDEYNLQVTNNLQTDVVNEYTAAAGVTIDGVLIKDGLVDTRDVSFDGSTLDAHVLEIGAHGVVGVVVGTDSPQTLINKTLLDPSNEIAAKYLFNGTNLVYVAGGSTPTTNQVLTAINGTTATWQTVNSGLIDHNTLLNYVADQHIAHSSVSIFTGSGLTGGGDIAASRTINFDYPTLITDATPDTAADFIATYDTSATTHKKILISSINHDALTNFVANEHIDHSAVSIFTGTGIQGGGNITSSRTLSLDINGLTLDAAPDRTTDYVATYDVSATTHKKVLLQDLFPGGVITDTQIATSVISTSTTSLTYIDLNSMTLTANTTGPTKYVVYFTATASTANSNRRVDYIINVNGVDDLTSERSITSSSANNGFSIFTMTIANSITNGQIIKIRWKRFGSATTITMAQRTMIMFGYLE
jgi:hypothetical protein